MFETTPIKTNKKYNIIIFDSILDIEITKCLNKKGKILKVVLNPNVFGDFVVTYYNV